MIISILNYKFEIELEVQLTLILTALLGVYLRFIFIRLQKQYFLRSNDKLLVFALLPVTGYVITSVISNDIALSLGMVGALSIVRFRTPIKNPTELVIYFLLITLGIVINVSVNLAINLILFITILFIILELYRQFKKEYLNVDSEIISESNHKLLITTKEKINENLENTNLSISHFSRDENSSYLYIFSLKNIQDGKDFIDNLNKESLISYTIE